MNKNILISSTEQWNPGDDFIRFGVKNLFKELGYSVKNINWILYNRNPDLFKNGFVNNIHKEKIWSNCLCRGNPKYIDLAVIAGSPEWLGKPLKRFYQIIRKQKIPLVILGAGFRNIPYKLTESELFCFKNLTKLAFVRDEYASRVLQCANIPHTIMPCPALFANQYSYNISNEIKKIGIIAQTENSKHSISFSIQAELIKLNIDIICHYIDEFNYFVTNFNNVRYSHDPLDYTNIFKDYDYILSTRLHGAIFAQSMGIPSGVITIDDTRILGAVKQFPFIDIVHPEKLSSFIVDLQNKPVNNYQNQYYTWREKIKNIYLNNLKLVMDNI